MGLPGSDERPGLPAAPERGRGLGLSDVHPRVVVALREQLQNRRRELASGAEHVGWKIGRGIVQGEEYLEPVIGYLTSATALEPGGTYLSRGAKALRVDAEVALEIGPEKTISGFGAALELVDVERPPDDFESIVAANIWHRAVAFGPLDPRPPSAATKARVSINGEVRESAEVPEDVAKAVGIASTLLAAVGERLEPGDRIIAGSLVHVAVLPGDEIVVDLGDLGCVEATIARDFSPQPRRGSPAATR